MSEHVHWITRNPHGDGNITACGKRLVFPMKGNGWRVRGISCPDCDRAICDHLHKNRDAFAKADAA
jgi:hypothetical protein